MKRRTKVLLAIGAVVILVVVLVPLLINANTFRPALESQLSQSLGRQVRLGSMSFSLFTGNLVADNVSIADDAAFSSQPFLQAKALKIGVEVGPLIFSRQLKVTHFAAEQPDVHLIHAANGTWNFSSIGKQAASQTAKPRNPSALSDLTVGKVAIDDGRISVTDQPATGQPLLYDHVNLSASQLSFAKRFPFTVAASLPGGGSLHVEGQAGPVNARDAADTPLDANIKLTHFDPVAAGVVKQGEGFAMLGDITAHLVSNGENATTIGTLHASKLQVVKAGAPAPKPVDIDFDLSQNLATRAGTVRRLSIKTGSVAALVGGSFKQTAQTTDLDLRLTGHGLSIDQLQDLLPALGVKLPNGSVLQGGTLTTDLIIRGPADAPVISGPVELSNTRLAGFNLGSKLNGIAALGGARTGDTTEVQTLRLALQSSPAGVRTDNIYALLPALGQATGAGVVSAAGALNYRLLVKLNTSSGVAGVATGLLGAFAGGAGRAVSSSAANGIPVTITGTTTNPIFTPDVKGIGGSLLQNQLGGRKANPLQNPAGALGRLLGKP